MSYVDQFSFNFNEDLSECVIQVRKDETPVLSINLDEEGLITNMQLLDWDSISVNLLKMFLNKVQGLYVHKTQ